MRAVLESRFTCKNWWLASSMSFVKFWVLFSPGFVQKVYNTACRIRISYHSLASCCRFSPFAGTYKLQRKGCLQLRGDDPCKEDLCDAGVTEMTSLIIQIFLNKETLSMCRVDRWRIDLSLFTDMMNISTNWSQKSGTFLKALLSGE